MNCPANKPGIIGIGSGKIKFGISAYFILGAEASSSIDLNECNKKLIDIFNESIQYEDLYEMPSFVRTTQMAAFHFILFNHNF